MLGIPFVRIAGESLLRLDVPTLTLHLFGVRIGIEELYLFLPAALALVLLFLLATLVLGRIWCGWACPQTTLADLAEGFARLIEARVRAGKIEAAPWRKALLHLFYLAAALLVGANLVWYFISPYAFFPRLLGGGIGWGAGLSLAVVAGAVYLDLAFVRRLLCREFCPYGRFQTVLIDPGTLTLRSAPEEDHRCLRCNACVRACPTGVDIRRGFQVECINCGRCLDACREARARRGRPGLIRYSFGLEGKGIRALCNGRMFLVLAAFLTVSAVLAGAVLHRPGISLEIARSPAPERLLDDGAVASFFTAYLASRSGAAQVFSLAAAAEDGTLLELRGPVREITLAPGARRQVSFAVVMPPPAGGAPVSVVIFAEDASRLELARAEASITLSEEH